MICARRPLRVAELQEAVAFDSADTRWNNDRIPDGDKIIRSCHGLVVRDSDSGRVRLAHHTVQQYLVSPQESVSGTDSTEFTTGAHLWSELQNLRRDHGSAEKMAGWLCIIYLSFSDFGTVVGSTYGRKKIDLAPAFKDRGPLSIPTALGLGKYLRRIPYKFFGCENRIKVPEIDYSKYLYISPKYPQPSGEFQSKFALLEYVIKYWEWHTRWVQWPSKSEGSAQFWQLIQHKILPFEFRPWGPNQHFGPNGCKGCPVSESDDLDAKDLPSIGLLHWAAEIGHLSVAEMIDPPLEKYLKHERHHDETLLIACRHGQFAFVKMLLGKRRFYLVDGRAIQTAFESANASILGLLLKEETVQDALIPSSSRLINICVEGLHQAASSGKSDIVKTVLADHAFTDATGATNGLYLAAKNGHLQVIREYAFAGGLKYFDRPEEKTGTTALHYAAANGHEEIVVFLIQHGSGYNVQNGLGETALIKAAQNGHSNVTKVLLEMGANALLRGGEKNPIFSSERGPFNDDPFVALKIKPAAIHHAVCYGHDTVVTMLSQFRDLICGTSKVNALHISAAYNHFNVVKALLLMGAETESRDASGMTALHHASRNGYYLVMWLLLDKGCEVKSRAHGGYTALHFAAIGGDIETIKLLVSRGAELTAKLSDTLSEKDLRGDTPLHLAAVRGNVDTVRALVECGLPLEESDLAGRTALDNAIWCGSLETTLALIELGAGWTHYQAFAEAANQDDCKILEKLLSMLPTVTSEDQGTAARCISKVVQDDNLWNRSPGSMRILNAWLAKRKSGSPPDRGQ